MSCRSFYLLVLVGFFCAGCQPEHINPLDPESDHYVPLPPVAAPETFFSRVYSVHSVHSPEVQAYTVAAEAWVVGDAVIDSAWVEYPEHAPWLLQHAGGGVWSARLTGSYFGDPHLGSVIGQPFRMLFHTTEGERFVRSPLYLFRVIATAPELLEPDSLDVVGAMPVLRWAAYAADFPFEFVVSVVRPVDPPFYETEVWNSGPRADSTVAVTLEAGLSSGRYYWTVAAVDEFNNSARSMAGSFIVAAETMP